MNISKLKARQLPVLDNPEVLTLLCKALADSLRLEILRLLRNESFGVMEICHILDIRQSALSHHLKILATAGLVSTRREGNSIFYRRPLLTDDDSLKQFKQQVFETVDRLPLGTRVLQQMKVIQRERSQLSLDFFNRNADKFREKQGLVTEYSQYAGSLQDLIGGLGLADESSVLEVGPGEGELLLRLAQSFRKLIALDNSSEMLERARGTIRGAKLNHVRFIHGDTRTAIRQGVQSDLIVFNMVLHHISSPAKTFRDAAAILNPGGCLLLVDLRSHDQDWVREACGDLWLGFEAGDLSAWAEKAGLAEGESLYLGLRNGFQIQMRVFIKTESRKR